MNYPPRIKGRPIPQPTIVGEVARIPLSRGLFAIIDVSDLHLVSDRTWGATRDRFGGVYAKTSYTRPDKRRVQTVMHRMICGIDDPSIEVDHWDGNGLNNRRANLRICDRSKNSWNRGLESTSTTGFKGVTYVKEDDRYEAKIRFHVTRHYLGRYATAEEAALAYDTAAELAFGDFARLNFPSPTCAAHFIHPERPPNRFKTLVTDSVTAIMFLGRLPLGKACIAILAQKELDQGNLLPGVKIYNEDTA